MQEVAAVIIGELLRDAKKKEFLGELCFDVVGSTLSQFKKEHYEKHILPILLPKVSVSIEELSPDALLLLIYMRKIFKVTMNNSTQHTFSNISIKFDVTTLGGQWKSSKLISSKNFPALKPALMVRVYWLYFGRCRSNYFIFRKLQVHSLKYTRYGLIFSKNCHLAMHLGHSLNA